MGVPGSANFLLSGAQGYQIERSLRFNSADSAYLNRTQNTGTTARWTFSTWVKRSALGSSNNCLISSTLTSSPSDYTGYIFFDINDRLAFYAKWGTDVQNYVTTQVFRDVSAWYHIVVAIDLTLSAPNGVKIYVNGLQVTSFFTSTYSNAFQAGAINNNYAHNIGRNTTNNSDYFNGYITETYFLNNAQLTPSSFGETNPVTGVWQPKLYTGTYNGTNSFYLKFADNSGTTSTTLGKDSSGNGNNWTPNNFSAVITGSYASTWTSSATGSPSGVQDPLGAFLSNSPTIPDNSQAAGRCTYVNHSGGTSWLQFTPAAPISGTTLRVFTYQPQGTSGADTWLNINGGADIRPWRVAANYTGWSTNITIPGGSLTSIKGSLSYGGASGMSIFAIEIDGVILRNSNEGIDSLIDTPTPYADGGNGRGNYATLSPLSKGDDATLANGNLDVSYGSAPYPSCTMATFGMPSGKWYWETTITASSLTNTGGTLGITNTSNSSYNSVPQYPGYSANGWSYSGNTGTKYNNGTSTAYGSTFGVNDIIGCAFDADTGKIWWSKNGTWQASGDPAAGTNAAFTGLASGTYFPAIGDGGGTSTFSASHNFGQRPFAYTPPSGFKALNTQNLPEPSIKKPSSYMDVLTYTGDGNATKTITGLGFNPDLVWIKNRNNANPHAWFDSVRGVNKFLSSNYTTAEENPGLFGYVSAFNSDGFTLTTYGPSGYGYVNGVSNTYVAWCWDESATPGFDIVTYTGNNTNRTIAHSLGVAPSMMIVKNRTSAANGWIVYHQFANASPATGGLRLNLTDAFITYSLYWNNTAPTSSVFTVGAESQVNGNTDQMVAYLWSEVAGFSKFGSYTGNGSSDGPFVYCGFRPRWVMLKKSSAAGDNWFILDAARDSFNVAALELCPNANNVELTLNYSDMDLTSNGFKIRSSDTQSNASGATFIFAAFAESPQKYSLAR